MGTDSQQALNNLPPFAKNSCLLYFIMLRTAGCIGGKWKSVETQLHYEKPNNFKSPDVM